MSEIYEFDYNALEEMLIVNYKDGFSYNMCDEGDVYSVAVKLNELQSTISRLEEENKKLQKENNALKSFIKDNFSEMMDSKMVIENEQDY